MVRPTCTARAISGKTGWTWTTCVSADISWRRKINALNSCVTRLTIHLAGVNVTFTEPSRVASLTCASQVNKLVISIELVTFFRRHTLTIVTAGAHVNRRTPGCARTLVVSSNKRKIELQTRKNMCDLLSARL